MKKTKLIILTISCVISLLLMSCSSNDEASLKCFDCDVDTQGNPDDVEYCDNGDGTMSAMFRSTGKTVQIDLKGNTFDDFIVTARTFGTCVEVKGQ